MNNPPTDPAPVRFPLTHSVHYVARGLPEVPNHYGPGVLAPSEITLTYRASPDSQLGRVHAYLAGRIWVDGTELPLMAGGLYGQHYDDGLDGWPEWLAEESRLHDPDAVPAGLVAVPPTTTDRAALRDRIAEALHHHLARTADIRPSRGGDLAFMPEVTDEERMRITAAILAVLPAGSEDTTTTRAERDSLGREADRLRKDWVAMRTRAEQAEAERDSYGEQLDEAAETIAARTVEVNRLTEELRRLAAETQPAHSCGNCEGVDPDSCLTNLDRPAVKAQQAVKQTPDTEDEWCKCRSCWGWFVEEHPGEDLDELGRDLGWWSGLPVHRDAPAASAGVQTDEKPVPCSAVALRVHHAPHGWEPQPGMDQVRCGGYPVASHG